MKLCILVTGAAFAPERQPGLDRLIAEIGPQCDALGVRLVVSMSNDRTTHLTGVYAGLADAMRDEEVTHVCGLTDDTLVVPHFVEVLLACIRARPDDVLDMVSNHIGAKAAYEAGNRWYSTLDAAIMGNVAPVATWRAYLEWRRVSLVDDSAVPFDDGLAIWLSRQGRSIYKPLPSPCQHDLTLPSLCGNQHQTDDEFQRVVRESQVWDPKADLRGVDWTGPVIALHRMFEQRHWEAPFRLKPEAWDLEAVYRIERNGVPVNPKHVFIATPAYGGPELAFLQSVSRVAEDLQAHGYVVQHYMTSGDSLVTRGRHMLCHDYLCSPAAYFLQWDADVEVEDATSVRCMIESGHGIIGGAYPFRDGSGQVVANALRETHVQGRLEMIDGCVKVAEVGTGFLLLRREVLIDMQKRHPELLYESDMQTHQGRPFWALFDVALEASPLNPARKRYASEDWRFCSLARADGHDVWCYVPPTFRHWGKTGHRGHISQAWGFGAGMPADVVKEAAE